MSATQLPIKYVFPCSGLCHVLPSWRGGPGGSHWTSPGGSGGGRGPGTVPNCGTETLGTEVDGCYSEKYCSANPCPLSLQIFNHSHRLTSFQNSHVHHNNLLVAKPHPLPPRESHSTLWVKVSSVYVALVACIVEAAFEVPGTLVMALLTCWLSSFGQRYQLKFPQ